MVIFTIAWTLFLAPHLSKTPQGSVAGVYLEGCFYQGEAKLGSWECEELERKGRQ